MMHTPVSFLGTHLCCLHVYKNTYNAMTKQSEFIFVIYDTGRVGLLIHKDRLLFMVYYHTFIEWNNQLKNRRGR